MENRKNFATYGIIEDALYLIDDSVKLEIYKKICQSREFDMQVIKAVTECRIVAPVYLSLGQESVAASIADLIRDYYIFAGHRAHDLYICLGADLKMFRDELLGLSSGFSKGRAGSSCLKYIADGIKLMPHHGLIGEQVPQAVGAAFSTGEPIVTFFGDGAAEEDYVLESLGIATTHKLPILFICIDNDLSILTTKEIRRTWSITKIAQAFGIDNAYDITDDPWTVRTIVGKWDGNGPMLVNCNVCRERWHSGVGIDGPRDWERNVIVKRQLENIFGKTMIEEIEEESRKEMQDLWRI